MDYVSVLRSALQFAHDGKTRESLSILDRFLRDADPESDRDGIVAIAGHAAITAEQIGDSQLAESYYQRGLQASPADPLLLLSIWGFRKRLGDVAGARKYFGECKRASLEQGNHEVFATLKELEDRDGDLG